MSNKIAVIKLNKDTVSWYDPINNIYLSEFKDKKADVYDDMSFESIRNGIKYKCIKVIEGEIPDEKCNIEHDLTSFYNKKEIDDKVNNFNEQFNTIMNKTTNQFSKPLISFSCDDGLSTDYTIVKPISEFYKIPFTCYLWPTSSLLTTYEKQCNDYLQNYLGWEFGGHGPSSWKGKSINELNSYFYKQKQDFENLGIKVETIAYPYGEYDDNVISVARKYFKMGLRTYDSSTSTINASINKSTFKSFEERRIHIGSSWMTLEFLKSVVDDAYNNNKWVVFYFHSSELTTHEQKLRDLIEYIQSKNIEIKTVSNAYNDLFNVNELDYNIKNRALLGENLFKNSFFTTDLTSWAVWDSSKVTLSTDVTYNSHNSVKFSDTGQTSNKLNELKQTVDIKGFDNYTLSCKVKSPDITQLDGVYDEQEKFWVNIEYLLEDTSTYTTIRKNIDIYSNDTWYDFKFNLNNIPSKVKKVRFKFILTRNGTVYLSEPKIEIGKYSTISI